MTTTTDLVTAYLNCWNETDAAARRDLLAEVFNPDVAYVDPMAEVHGIDELDATIAAVRQQFPDFVFRQEGRADAHHNQTRFTWSLVPAGVEAPIVGCDVAVTGADGRISSVLGFLDKVPAR